MQGSEKYDLTRWSRRFFPGCADLLVQLQSLLVQLRRLEYPSDGADNTACGVSVDRSWGQDKHRGRLPSAL